ncbi:MAG: acetolactate synthase large subunit [Caulobacteraceae bacterium]|nr:acetolactate synthase large subunit [Caulobacteraceae bacterium]
MTVSGVTAPAPERPQGPTKAEAGPRTGAAALLETLAENGAEVCFANPGTSEMQLVAAFDREPRVRGVLCLFEGVATGAADGYGRMAGRPAATLLHLGPGLANGLANLHNARRAGSPILNLVGDHASFHRHLDSPLTSDIEALARTASIWTRTASSTEDARTLAGEAIEASLGRPGGVATLVLPGEAMWSPASGSSRPARARAPMPRSPDPARLSLVVEKIRRAKQVTLLLGSGACGEDALPEASRLAAAGISVMHDTFVARLPRGEGRFAPQRMPYFGGQAIERLAGVDLLLTVASRAPVAFFGYPETRSAFAPPDAEVLAAGEPDQDPVRILGGIADALGAPASGATVRYDPPAPATGKFNAHTIGAVIAGLLPEAAIISDDAATSGAPIFAQTAKARAHDYLFLTGGSIGQGLPVALGAALAAPARKVICLTGDGAGLYTPQALWSMARENADVAVVVFANRAYRILNLELERTGTASAGDAARQLLDLQPPVVDWAGLSRSFGVRATRCETLEDFSGAFAEAMAQRGPALIEAVLAA